jgi:hypothetical protein
VTDQLPRAPKRNAGTEVPLRITVLRPLPGVMLMLQQGRDELIPPTRQDARAMTFDFSLRVTSPLSASHPRWAGAFAQGTAEDRFVYVNVGRRAGQVASAWDRRAKVKLKGITADQIREVLASPGLVIEASFEGVGADGGPACATVPLIGGSWQVAHAAAEG